MSFSKIYGTRRQLLSAEIKPPGLIPKSRNPNIPLPNKKQNFYAKKLYIYFTNSENLKNIISNIYTSKKEIVEISKLPNNKIKESLIKVLQNNNNIDNKIIKQNLNSYKTQNEYTIIQQKFRAFHKNLKKISYYRYIRDKESIETMPKFKKEIEEFTISNFPKQEKKKSFSIGSSTKHNIKQEFEKFSFLKFVAQTVIKINGISNVQKLLPQLFLLCKYLLEKTGRYKKEFNFLTKQFEEKNKTSTPNNSNYSKIGNTMHLSNIDDKIFIKGISDYFIDQKWLLPLFKNKLNYFINKSQRNQDIKDLLNIMSQKYPMIDTAVCLLVYSRKNNTTYNTTYKYISKFIWKSVENNNSNTLGDIDDIDILFIKKNNLINLDEPILFEGYEEIQSGGELVTGTTITIAIVVFSTFVAIIRTILKCLVKKEDITLCIPRYFTDSFLISVFYCLLLIIFLVLTVFSGGLILQSFDYSLSGSNKSIKQQIKDWFY